ncbi:MAG: hypothetical protein AB7G06_00960 [Bdellovibrionales bacterium]
MLSNKKLAVAALVGLFTAGALTAAPAFANTEGKANCNGKTQAEKANCKTADGKEKHACKGANSCKGNGADGKNACKGKGSCRTDGGAAPAAE